MKKWLLLAGAIGSEVTASLSLKGALDRPALYVVVAVGFVAAFTFLFAALGQGMPLGAAYGIWAACGVALTAMLSAAIYDEPLTPLMGLGIVVIIGGVLLVELGSQAARSRTAAPDVNQGGDR
ncbi:multidrug efflux SMR transporter [Aeromicrobium sp. Leaf350]|uniref:DMT family transporter n=1 Tax=Aeromicrobium sp. Leaf350 TaxID=2876565 RepID=UPI001E5389B0|nr:SMR family transporter [Aeromicrobium sp. Leaf350]